MIHSFALSTTRLPADYYAAPASEVRPIFPRWVPLGCGIAAAITLFCGFVGGAVVMHSGLGKIMAIVLDMSQPDLVSMIDKNVPAGERDALKNEMAQLSKNLETEKTSVAQLQPVLAAIRDAIDDEKVTRAEVQTLTKSAHDANLARPAAKKK
jgi:hypothetical protein